MYVSVCRCERMHNHPYYVSTKLCDLFIIFYVGSHILNQFSNFLSVPSVKVRIRHGSVLTIRVYCDFKPLKLSITPFLLLKVP